MRSYKLASLILLAGVWSVACNDSGDGGDGDGDGDGDGVGAATGDGDVGVGDGDTGDGDGDGDSGTTHPGCTNTAVATGTPTMIDDFNHGAFPNLVDESDGRIGTWAHGHWINPAGADPTHVQEGGMGGAAPGYLEAECLDEADDQGDYPWCNTAWDEAEPWLQWASIDLALALYSETDVNCYDGSVFTGIKFKARSAVEGNSIRVQISTPDAKPDTGETYQGPPIPLTTAWEPYTVDFSDVLQPTWSTVTAPLATNALRSISFVVRTRVDQEDGSMIVGETLAPYNIQLDDVEFY